MNHSPIIKLIFTHLHCFLSFLETLANLIVSTQILSPLFTEKRFKTIALLCNVSNTRDRVLPHVQTLSREFKIRSVIFGRISSGFSNPLRVKKQPIVRLDFCSRRPPKRPYIHFHPSQKHSCNWRVIVIHWRT